MQTFTTHESDVRLDVFVHEHAGVSRSFAGRLCDQQKVWVNDEPMKPSYKVKSGDVITVLFDQKDLQVHEQIDLPILYEDNDVIVINKPTGILSHSKGAYNPEATVATFIAPKLQDLSGERGGVVHRLDRATSGVMICAKNETALIWLQKQFSTRRVHKTYLAVISGTLNPSEAIIDMPVARNPRKPKTFHVDPHGRKAVTKYKVLEQSLRHSLVLLEPQTGRTHQLRVHLSQQGHPIVGDEFYDGEPSERLMLHAYKLSVLLPNKTQHEFIAEIPSAFHTMMHERAASSPHNETRH